MQDGINVMREPQDTIEARGTVTPPPDVADDRLIEESTVEQVLAAVDAGQVTVEEALAEEKANRNRVTLVAELERRADDAVSG